MKALLTVGIAIILAAVASEREVASMASSSGPMLTNYASFDGRRLLLAGGDAPTASLWDVETGLKIRDFVGHTEGVRSVALSPDGRQVLTGAGNTTIVRPSTDSSVRLWDIGSGRELRRFDEATYPAWIPPVYEVGFSENGRQVMGRGASRGVAIWDGETTELLFQQPSYWYRPEDSLRGGLVLTRTPGNRVRIWEYRSGNMLVQIDVPSRISSSQWSRDGSAVVIASGREVSTWNPSTGRLARTYVGHTEQVLDAMFSADGQRIVSASVDGSVRLWDRVSGKPLGQLVHEDGPVRRALIRPDGSRVLTEWTHGRTGRLTTYTSLWDVDSGRELVRLGQTQRPLGFSPDGRSIPVVYGPSLSTTCCRLDSLLDTATGQPIRRFGR
jgi:WD40 repeat protein